MAEPDNNIQHPVLGHLVWDAPAEVWRGEVDVEGMTAEVWVRPGDEDREAFVAAAAEMLPRVLTAERRIRLEAVSAQLAELYGIWRNEGEPALTQDELLAQLELEIVQFAAIVPITLTYVMASNPKVFGGHSIDVEVSQELSFLRVGLVG